MIQELNNQFPPVPESIMNALRREFIVKMQIIDGTLPNDLQGYVFIVAPVGNVDSQSLPYTDGNTFLSGDGMIYRLDFTQPGQVTLKTQIVKPPDYVVDQFLELLSSKVPFLFDLFKFYNHGVARFSYLLGSRNLLNTAFLPIKFPKESSERLFVTYDAGRPYEINTESLLLENPVGQNKEWKSTIPIPYPFKPILSTAHPAFDTYTHEMFTVNYGRSLSNFLGKNEHEEFQKCLTNLSQELLKRSEEQKLEIFNFHTRKNIILQVWFRKILQKLKEEFKDFVNLIRWDDTGSLTKWELIDSDGLPIKIKQSMHQIGVTEDYVVLLDTSFTVGIEQIMSNCLPFPELFPLANFSSHQEFSNWLRKLFQTALKPSPDSTFYIVRREDLKKGKNVVAHKIVIDREASHFLVDYKNPNQQITLHVAHICAWHVAEWLHNYDKSAYPEQLLNKKLYGMQQCEMDISKMGRYVIDVSSQEPKEIKEKSIILKDEFCTWGPGLFTYLDRLPGSGKTPERLDDIYWISFGLWEELMTDSMLELYKDYEYRQKSLEDVLKLGKDGIPATLFRLHTSSNEPMAIADYYKFPPSHIALSPQFIPRNNSKENLTTNGYIICFVFGPKEDELWIFDAGNLKNGPQCKLHHPDLNVGFSLHATWLQNISSQEPIRQFSIKEDYQDSVKELLNLIEEDFSSFANMEIGILKVIEKLLREDHLDSVNELFKLIKEGLSFFANLQIGMSNVFEELFKDIFNKPS